MNAHPCPADLTPSPAIVDEASLPAEWRALRARFLNLPAEVRAELAPLVEEALEHARFRERALGLAQEAVEQFRLERLLLQFDLEATRREREALARRLLAHGEDGGGAPGL